MQIKSIVAGTAIALVAGAGSVSANEPSVADTAGDTGTPYAMLNGFATSQMSVQEMAATRGGAVNGDTASFLAGGEFPIPVPQGNSSDPYDTEPPPILVAFKFRF